MTSDQTFVIIGASFAGAKAAEALRGEGFDGRLLLIGAEQERPYERPPLSKDYLRGEAGRDKIYVHDEGFYTGRDIDPAGKNFRRADANSTQPHALRERRDTDKRGSFMAVTTPQQHASPVVDGAAPQRGTAATAKTDWRDPRYQAFALMRLAFAVAPIAFGLDKFFNVMVHWPNYLAPWINDIAPGTGQQFMYFVGATEILAGVIVALKPRYGAYVVAGWLAGIIFNLLTYSGFYDIALRDFGLMLGALTLARLASVYDPPLQHSRR